MTALFDNPVRATLTRGEEEVLLVGVVEYEQRVGEQSQSRPALLVNLGNGELTSMDISDVVTHWRYGVIPHGRRAGQLGWYDFVPEGEEPNQEITVEELDDPDS